MWESRLGLPVAMRQTKSVPRLLLGGFQTIVVNKMVINNFHNENQSLIMLSRLYKQQNMKSQRLLMPVQSTIGRFNVYKKRFDSFGSLAKTKMECHHLKRALQQLGILQSLKMVVVENYLLPRRLVDS